MCNRNGFKKPDDTRGAMRAHCFQHVEFEGLGSIESWLAAHGCEIATTRFFESGNLPDPGDTDFLVVMGGPMSVNDETLPWLASEKRFIRRMMDMGKPVLGICLGAQLIACALGARVYSNHTLEIGWYPVEGINGGSKDVFCFPEIFEAFHWHGETFDLPAGVIRLAGTRACENQAFQFGTNVIGLQFHLEATRESVTDLVTHCRDELIPSVFVQTEKEILCASPDRYAAANRLMANVLAYLLHRGA